MTDAEILEAVLAIAREHLRWDGELTPDMRLVEDLRLDSLKLLTLAVAIEDRFRIRLDDVESQLETVADLLAAIRSRHAP
ncbi:MAG TPA: acyl carrier protein [Thermoanaerobaculaceae bacterium]|nr:acyl carrier protein [Thermoanaerobaculaceae bacterium]HRS14825.1 acyl carrier protein [Thermoanaerobaculaceae bacterium]